MAVTHKVFSDNNQLSSGSKDTLYTATAVTARIDQATITNTTAGAITFELWLVPSGGTANNSTLIIDTKSVAANETVILSEIIGHALEAGGTIQAEASAATSLNPYISGIEFS